MEVRGPDGDLTKTVEAESATFWIVDKRQPTLELEFQGGNVTFHQGSSGRSTKSPFYNDRYLIVVLLNDGKEWLATNRPFVRVK
jgi:hypothetical protein